KTSPIELHVNSGDFFGKNGRLQQITLSRYRELNGLNKGLIVRLINFLDLIYSEGLSDNKIKTYLTDDYYYSEENTFISVLKNDASYDDKLRFYAFYNYLPRATDSQELNEWLRVVYNLTENTIINTADEFYKALFSFDKLRHSTSPILESLANNIDIGGFAGAQIIEEKKN
ncbi:DUF262 domain-containing protein, partial [Vibrio sp. 1-Bac 57]